MSIQRPIYNEDYSSHWPINVQGKTIIDIGADYGSTAYYFKRKGAVQVVCVEGNPRLYRQLQINMRLLPGCVAIYKNIKSPGDLAEVLAYTAETVKVDIEGAEKHLLEVDPGLLQQHYEWIIELHRNINRKAFIDYFRSVGFDTVKVFSWGIGLTVIHFVRHDVTGHSLTENLKHFVLLYSK